VTLLELIEETHPPVSEHRARYPKLVEDESISRLQRLAARIDRVHLGNGVFLGHCARHNVYFLDRLHTHDEIRCPLCDAEWLLEHGF
jgi:hypothetical protein